MKKVFAVMAIAGMFAFVACGPKAEEKTEEPTEATTTESVEATADQSATMDQAAAMDSTAAAPEMADSAAAH